MDLLIVEPLEAEVLQWLDARHELFYAPRLPQDRRVFLDALADTRAALLPAQANIDAVTLAQCPRLRAIGRIVGGSDGLDMTACTRAGVEVIRPVDAAAPAEAEFMLGALLALLRPSPEESNRVTGRELGACTVGLVGMNSAARTLAKFLQPLGSRVIGYDPGVHASDPQWSRWGVQACALPEVFEQADAVCVQLPYYSRYQGLLGERVLAQCRAGQVLVSISPLDLFDENVLADALRQRRINAAWLDCLDPGAQSPGRPLHAVRGLIATPRLGAYTREARVRSAWSVARRLDEVLRLQPRASRRTLNTALRSGANAATRPEAAVPSQRPGTPAPTEAVTATPAPRQWPRQATDAPPADDARLPLSSLPGPATPQEVLDIRRLLPRASDLDLRPPAVPPQTRSDTQAAEARPATAQAQRPRRRMGDDEHILSRSD